jgi:hypothetical protein
MIRVSGELPVSTLMGVAAEAVTGSKAATTKMVITKERAFKVKVSLQRAARA